MNYPFDLAVISSLKEYLDHKVCEKLGAWQNKTVPLFLDLEDDRMSNYKKIGSGPNQWVYDSSMVGATIADPNQFSHTSWKAAKTDFKNSRFIVPSSVSALAPTSAIVAVKHFNSYVSSRDDEDLLQNTSFDLPPEMTVQTKASQADSYHAPCYFVKSTYTINEGLAMGGLDKTIFNIRVTCFLKSEMDLLILASVFRDLGQTTTMVLPSTPLDEYNDLKSRPWNFHTKMQESIASGNKVIHIEKASFNPIKSDNINSKFKNTYIGLASLTVFVARYSRQ